MFLHEQPIEPERRAAIDDFFTRSIFEDPWEHGDQPSLVYETAEGEVTGFIGVLPRDMSFDGAPIRGRSRDRVHGRPLVETGEHRPLAQSPEGSTRPDGDRRCHGADPPHPRATRVPLVPVDEHELVPRVQAESAHVEPLHPIGHSGAAGTRVVRASGVQPRGSFGGPTRRDQHAGRRSGAGPQPSARGIRAPRSHRRGVADAPAPPSLRRAESRACPRRLEARHSSRRIRGDARRELGRQAARLVPRTRAVGRHERDRADRARSPAPTTSCSAACSSTA